MKSHANIVSMDIIFQSYHGGMPQSRNVISYSFFHNCLVGMIENFFSIYGHMSLDRYKAKILIHQMFSTCSKHKRNKSSIPMGGAR